MNSILATRDPEKIKTLTKEKPQKSELDFGTINNTIKTKLQPEVYKSFVSFFHHCRRVKTMEGDDTKKLSDCIDDCAATIKEYREIIIISKNFIGGV